MYQDLFRLQEKVFKVIANQKRLEIVHLLSGRELTVTQMTEMLGIRQANLSQHLALLRNSGILVTRRKGLQVIYSLADDRISEAVRLVRGFLAQQRDGRLPLNMLDGKADPLYPIVKDVVCGMRVSAPQAGASAVHEGHAYYFCASGCQKKFVQAPFHYLQKQEGTNG